MRAGARALLRGIDVRVEGLEHVPTRGPALLVCRHYHHLYDGAVLLSAIPRPVRIVVALDWAAGSSQRGIMELLCKAAGWPVVLRDPARGNPWGPAYERRERRGYLRRAIARSVELLRQGELLAIFPQGYPVVDPLSASGDDERWFPFASGFLTIARRAAREGVEVPLVPAGFAYSGPRNKPARVSLRFGTAESPGDAQKARRLRAGSKSESGSYRCDRHPCVVRGFGVSEV